MLIYDIEIEKAIPPKDPSERLDGIVYCDGWTDHANMGVSVVGTYDYLTDQYNLFWGDSLKEFGELITRHSIVAGFNNLKFDNAVLAAVGIVIEQSRSYDILQEVWKAAGGRFAPSGLDALCSINLRLYKTGNGAMAPVDWQRGDYKKVMDYCLNDVRLTKQLMDCILEGRPLISPKDGQLLVLRRPYA